MSCVHMLWWPPLLITNRFPKQLLTLFLDFYHTLLLYRFLFLEPLLIFQLHCICISWLLYEQTKQKTFSGILLPSLFLPMYHYNHNTDNHKSTNLLVCTRPHFKKHIMKPHKFVRLKKKVPKIKYVKSINTSRTPWMRQNLYGEESNNIFVKAADTPNFSCLF